MKNYCLLLLSAALFEIALLDSGAWAAEQITLTADQSRIIRLDALPGTVVVGNPAIADVTIDGKSLFLHPKSYGLTNVLIYDNQGKTLGDYMVSVAFQDSHSVSMYGPGGRSTFDCRIDCEPTLRIGDKDSFFSAFIGQASSKNGFAAGQAQGDQQTALPAAPSPP